MKQEAARRRKQGCSPSAISRYLGSDATLVALPRLFSHRFNPLYRGTWFPTLSGTHLMSHPRRFPSAMSRYLVSNARVQMLKFLKKEQFPSAISRYLVSNLPKVGTWLPVTAWFPSAISRYLVSNNAFVLCWCLAGIACFHPLYRGTWFPTLPQKRPL